MRPIPYALARFPLQANGREADGGAWEVYWWIDPSVAPDPAAWPAPTEWRTQLVQPIK
jgi:hypothetical protein